MWRLLETIERLIWLIVAAVIGGTWVAYESLTGREIPGHAHPVFAALMAAALTWGGIDLRKTRYWRHKLLGLAQETEVISPADADRIAARIAAMELEDPMLLKAIQAAALRDAGMPVRRAGKRPTTKKTLRLPPVDKEREP